MITTTGLRAAIDAYQAAAKAYAATMNDPIARELYRQDTYSGPVRTECRRLETADVLALSALRRELGELGLTDARTALADFVNAEGTPGANAHWTGS